MTNKKEKRKVPELRFPEFSGEWEEKKLYDISDRVTRKNKNLISTLPLTISAKYGLVDQSSYFNKSVSGSNLENYYLIKNGEFAYNKSYSKGYPFGAIKRLNNYKQGILSTLYICFKPNKFIDTDFLEKYFDSTKWHREVSAIAVEGARNHGLLNIPVNEFFNVRLHLPNTIQEQQKIGEFFSKLDRQIELEEKKLALLEEQKKGYMQKIFSQELRFKDENGEEYPEWEKRRLDEICKLSMGFTPSTKKEEFWTGKLPWLSIAGMKSKYTANSNKYISEIATINKKIVKKGTLLMSFKLSIGNLTILKEDMYTNEAICHFNWIDNSVLNEYAYYYLHTVDVKSYGSRAAKGITLNSDNLNSILIRIPEKNEQKKIANILSKLDGKIDKQSIKISNFNKRKAELLRMLLI